MTKSDGAQFNVSLRVLTNQSSAYWESHFITSVNIKGTIQSLVNNFDLIFQFLTRKMSVSGSGERLHFV